MATTVWEKIYICVYTVVSIVIPVMYAIFMPKKMFTVLLFLEVNYCHLSFKCVMKIMINFEKPVILKTNIFTGFC